jgi:hypothetical protein
VDPKEIKCVFFNGGGNIKPLFLIVNFLAHQKKEALKHCKITNED